MAHDELPIFELEGDVIDQIDKPNILIIEARFHEDISEKLAAGAIAVLEEAEIPFRRMPVPGALEIAPAIRYAMRAKEFSSEFRRYDGFIVLGCVIRGETPHFDLVCQECARGIEYLAQEYTLALGFGVLTVDNKEQALARAGADKKNFGMRAARTCLDMIDLKRQLKLFPRL